MQPIRWSCPLAIELAAARVKGSLPCRHAHSALPAGCNCSRVALATFRSVNRLCARPRSDWSYDLLRPRRAENFFRRLSPSSAGGCTLESVEAVCDAKADLDLDLLSTGWLRWWIKAWSSKSPNPRSESRFQDARKPSASNAREKLEASKEETRHKARLHAAYCLVLAEEAATEQGEAVGSEWLENFRGVSTTTFAPRLDYIIENRGCGLGFYAWVRALFRFLGTARVSLRRQRLGWGKPPQTPSRCCSLERRGPRALFAAGILTVEQGDYLQAEALVGESLRCLS